jgi:hypothetical protein
MQHFNNVGLSLPDYDYPTLSVTNGGSILRLVHNMVKSISTMVQNLPRHLKVGGLIPATGTGSDKMAKCLIFPGVKFE